MAKKDDSFKNFVLDQLGALDELECKRMFGGHGLYLGDAFFGILHDSHLYLKTNERTVGDYKDRGMQPFRPTPKQTLKNYYEVPVDIIEDHDELAEWARRAAGG